MSSVGLLSGQLALVTGAGSGIGRAVCQVFAREGARVAAVDLNHSATKETVAQLQGEHESFEADVSSTSSVTKLLADVTSSFTSVPTISVNCAGITRDKYLVKMSEQAFDEVINVNLKGTFLITQAVAKSMMESKLENGSIINISSIVGKMGNIGQVNYAASKAGVVGLTKTAAKELASFGIRCNAVLPGFIDTPMVAAVPETTKNMLPLVVPLGRMGRPEEIAEVCLFLASDRSSYMTGAALEVTGGMSM